MSLQKFFSRAKTLLPPWMFQEIAKGLEPSRNTPVKIQSVSFSKEKFSKEAAQAWMKKNNLSCNKMDESDDNGYVYIQRNPTVFPKMTEVNMGDGVTARVGKISPTSSQVHVPSMMGNEDKILKSAEVDHHNFAVPAEKKYPIYDESHARNSLKQSIGKADESKVREAVYARYPMLRPAEIGKADTSQDVRRVAKIAVMHGSKILMGKRRDNGKWTFPGGHVDGNETMKEGALRELEEETGIKAHPLKISQLTGIDELKDKEGKPLHVQSWKLPLEEKARTSMKSDPDGEVERWRWMEMKALPDEVMSNLHVPADRCNICSALGLSTKQEMIAKFDDDIINAALGAQDEDDNLDLQQGIDNLEGGLLKSALGEDDNAEEFSHDDDVAEEQTDYQRLTEGIDWEMAHTTQDWNMARDAAVNVLAEDPDHYRKLRDQEEGTDDVLAKDTEETEEDPFAGEGWSLDLGSGTEREPGYVGIDTYPHDPNTIVHDLNMGIPFPDASVSRVRLSNVDMEDHGPILDEIHRVLKPGGEFVYQGNKDLLEHHDFEKDYPGLVLVHQDDNDSRVAKDIGVSGTMPVVRQQFQRIAIADPATANDAEPRIGVSQIDQMPGDAILAADALSYYWSDATSSGRGNQAQGYPSQGALDKLPKGNAAKDEGGSQTMSTGPVRWVKAQKGEEDGGGTDDDNSDALVDTAQPTQAEVDVQRALNQKNPNPAPPQRLARKSAVEKSLRQLKMVPIFKADAERQIVYGVVLAPNEIDSQEDYMVPEEIEKTAHDYLKNARVIGSGHSKAIEAHPVESFIAPQDFEQHGQYGNQVVKKGSWVLGVKIEDPEEWEKVKNGEYTGFSVGGLGVREQK